MTHAPDKRTRTSMTIPLPLRSAARDQLMLQKIVPDVSALVRILLRKFVAGETEVTADDFDGDRKNMKQGVQE